MVSIWGIIGLCLASVVLTVGFFIIMKADQRLKKLGIECDKLHEQRDVLVKFNNILIDDNVQMANELERIKQENKKQKKSKKQSQSVDKD